MSQRLVPPSETADQLRALAAVAGPALQAQPDLAQVVLRRAHRQRRFRLATAGVVGGVAVVVALAAALLPGQSDFFAVTQPSAAMDPTVGVSEEVVFNRVLAPIKGDVVIAHLASSGFEYSTMSRVVALPGDSVACPLEPSGGCDAVVVNGDPLDENYLNQPTKPFPLTEVPQGDVFVLGDNRRAANDSRFVGAVSLGAIYGVAVQIIDSQGNVRPVPGAPTRVGPGGGDSVDPAGPVPPARVVP